MFAKANDSKNLRQRYNAFTKRNEKSRVERQSTTKTLMPSRLVKSGHPYIHTDLTQKRTSTATVII